MSGISFVLRKLARQNDTLGIGTAIPHASLAVAGPWLFTILVLGIVTAICSYYLNNDAMTSFRLIIMYNFAFSLVLSAPVFMLATHYLADVIYHNREPAAPGILIGSLALIYLIQLPLVALFYFYYADVTHALALSAIINYMLVASIWLTTIFFSVFKAPKTFAYSVLAGVVITITTASLLTKEFGTTGMINGFNIGLSCMLASLLACVLAHYPHTLQYPLIWLHYLRKYWEIALGGLLYSCALWVDKWIMWLNAPEAQSLANHMISYPQYDSALFLAYLTIIPAITLFMFSIEPHFFRHYAQFFHDIKHKATFRGIRHDHRHIIQSIIESSRNLLILQGSITILALFTAPALLEFFKVSTALTEIFRYGAAGAFFHIMLLFITIILAYFDNRKLALSIQLLFLLTNAGFTWFSLQAGTAYYGAGYCAASILTFIIAAIVTIRYLLHLPYHAFITTNSSVEQ